MHSVCVIFGKSIFFCTILDDVSSDEDHRSDEDLKLVSDKTCLWSEQKRIEAGVFDYLEDKKL